MFQMAESGSEQSLASDSLDGGAAESLRRATFVLIARMLAAVSLTGLLPALWMLPAGQFVPFAVSIAGFATGLAINLAVDRTGGLRPLPILLGGMTLIGGGLSILDPALADFGLATVTMVPVLAALLGDRAAQKLAWSLLVVALAAAAFSRSVLGPMPALFSEANLVSSVIAFVVSAFAVAIAALRLGALIERTAKAQTDTFRELIENFRYVVVRLTHEGKATFASRSAETLLGCQQYELAGEGLIERVHVQDRPSFLTGLSEAAYKNQPRVIEMRVRKDGVGSTAVPSFVWVECGLSPIHPGKKASAPYEVMVLLRDISERVSQREEMNCARLAAQEASEAKSRFLATIGHELRTPLNAIVGFSDMMRNGLGMTSAEAQREYAELIHQSGMHLLETVSMLLDMSKIEAGKFELQIDEFAPEALLAPSISMVEPMARTKRIEIAAEIAPDLPSMRGDERACRQIAINLLSNAVKFSEPGGAIHVGLLREGRFIALSVSDKGIGMSSDVVARLGEPFYQAHVGHARKFEGTGLGLSIVKGLVDLHQGQIDVQSRPGNGTKVTVLMPVAGPVGTGVASDAVASLNETRPAQSVIETVRRSAAL